MSKDEAAQADLRSQLIESLQMIERLQKTVAAQRAAAAQQADTADPIAVVGLGCRFPGGSGTPDAFWRMLRQGTDTTGEFPAARGDFRPYYDPDPDAPGKSYTRRGAFLDRADTFEPGVFGISPREALGMDPQQRLALEVAWESLESAGYAPDALDSSPTGVFVGVSTTDYVRMRQSIGDIGDVDGYQLMGEPSFIAGRISFTLGLQGPSKVVDTTCSSSLVALHDACSALRGGECDMALAGGVNLMLSPYGFVLLSKFRGLAPDGRCKTFDASADGYGRGEGAGMLVLKRLADAERDGDHIHAVVRGSSVLHDGRSSGMTVPNPASQQKVIRAALAQSGLSPQDIKYVEAHGTGTALGDPIELRALEAVVGRHHTADDPLLIGSVKTNIGHLESAAGVAGLMKLILALQYAEIPPHLHFDEPNGNVDWNGLHIKVTAEGRPWPTGRPLRAGAVSSFGASGTNAHAVVSAAPERPEETRTQYPMGVLTVSARSESALRKLATAYADRLRGEPAPALGDVCFTSHVGRSRMKHGLAVTGTDAGDLARALEVFAAGSRDDALSQTVLAPHRGRKAAWLFTGQGSQYAHMGEGLRAEPVYREAIERVAALMDPLMDKPLAELLTLPESDDSELHQTGYTQPAVFAVEYALAQQWLAWGLRPAAVMGHSVGEITAACVAGALTLEDAVKLITARGRLMQALPPGGVMATLVCDGERAQEAIAGYEDTVSVATLNGPMDTVIAGPREDVGAITAQLLEEGIKNRLLRVSHAFHSPLMKPMLDDLRQVSLSLQRRKPDIRVISNLTGTDWGEGALDPEYWVKHAASAVRFRDGIRTLHEEGFRTFLEIGPQPVLSGLGARGIDDPDCVWIPSLRRGHDDRMRMLSALGTLYLRGADVDWQAWHADEDVRRVPLPTYAWEGETYWFDEAGPSAGAAVGELVPGLGRRLRAPVATYELALDDERWQRHVQGPDADKDGDPELGLTALAETALLGAQDALGGAWTQIATAVRHAPLAPYGGKDRSVQLTVEPGSTEDEAVFEVRSLTTAEEAAGAPWTRHAAGSLRRRPPKPPAAGGDPLEVPAAERDLAGVLGTAVTAVSRAAGLEAPEEGVTARIRTAACPAPALVDAIRVRAKRAKDGAAEGSAEFLDADGAVVGGAALLRVLPAAQATPKAAEPWRHPDELLYRLEWREPVDPEPAADLAGEDILLVADTGGTAARLAERLTALGARPTVVEPPTASPEPAAGRPYGEQVRQVLDGWLAGAEHAARIVTLAGIDSPELADAVPATLNAYRERAEIFTIALVQALHDREDLPGVRVAAVTRGAMPAAEDQTVHDAVANTVWGMARSVALEHHDLWAGLVDLDPAAEDADAEAEQLADAIARTGDEDEQALRAGRRLVARLVPSSLTSAELRARPVVRADGTYLITGGFGGIGKAVAHWLIQQGAGRLVLLGRQPLPPRKSWDDPDLPAGVRERIAVVRELAASGAKVEVAAANVTDAKAIGKLVDKLAAGPLPLRGVIHAAGLSGPQFVREITAEEYDRVWQPKVVGGTVLDQATSGLDLDIFLGFSSIASSWGSQHLTSYSSANAFLDGVAHARHARGQAALTVNWGPWELPSNLYGEEEMAFLRATGLAPLSAPQCLKLLGALLAARVPQHIVNAANWSVYKPVLEARARRPVLELIDDTPEDTGPEGPSQVLDELVATAPEEREDLLGRYLREQLAQIMRLEVAALDGPFHLLEMGVDSLMVMELVSRTRKDLRIAYETRDFFATDANFWAEFLLRKAAEQHDDLDL